MKRDERALVGLPLRLVVYIIVVALVVPIAWSSAQAYSRRTTENSIEYEINYLERMISHIYIYHEDTRRVEVDFPSGFMADLEWVEIGGGENDPWSKLSTIRYKMSYTDVRTVVISEPNIPVTHFNNGESQPLRLGEGQYTLYLENLEDDSFLNGTRSVEVSLL